MKIFRMRIFILSIFRCQDIFGLLFFKADFRIKISYIFFIRNSLTISYKIFLTIFYIKDLHFLLNIFSFTFFYLTLDRGRQGNAHMQRPSGRFFRANPPPFLSTQPFFLVK